MGGCALTILPRLGDCCGRGAHPTTVLGQEGFGNGSARWLRVLLVHGRCEHDKKVGQPPDLPCMPCPRSASLVLKLQSKCHTRRLSQPPPPSPPPPPPPPLPPGMYFGRLRCCTSSSIHAAECLTSKCPCTDVPPRYSSHPFPLQVLACRVNQTACLIRPVDQTACLIPHPGHGAGKPGDVGVPI